MRAWPSKVLTVVHIWGEWSEKQCQLKGRCIQQRYRSLPKRDFFRPKSRSGIDRYFLFRQTGPLCSLKMKIIKKKMSKCHRKCKYRRKIRKFLLKEAFFFRSNLRSGISRKVHFCSLKMRKNKTRLHICWIKDSENQIKCP